MLNIINNIQPFIEDNYRRINVREYARIIKISPPTASKLLSNLNKDGLIKKEEDRQYIFYHANKESKVFVDLSRIYWGAVLEKSGIIENIKEELLNPVVILFGSLSKAEVKENSDIDLAIFTPTKKELKLEKYEKILGRKIQVFIFSKKEELKSKELLNNILNGYKILGEF
jgi:DNA-binding transcriptional ArsR family regulator